MATRLFVGNLPENTLEDDLRSAFSSYGAVENLDLKSKSTTENEKKFAFVTISGCNYDIETCISHFSKHDFNGSRLYVTRARESFLERLERERQEAQLKEAEKAKEQKVAKKTPILKLKVKLNPRKRKIEESQQTSTSHPKIKKTVKYGDGPDMSDSVPNENAMACEKRTGNILQMYKKKQDSDLKRIEAMKKKTQEFKQKKMIVKTGLTDVDKAPNKKIIFSDNEDGITDINGLRNQKHKPETKKTLFDDDEISDDEVNFEIKEQFEGRKGQKVLDLQSKYKSDKRFVLDERFIEDEEEAEKDHEPKEEDNQIELNQVDEKAKQLNILQDVLGIPIRKKISEEERDGKKNRPKIGMLRFDPSQPDHAKFLAPVENTKQESTKKTKKKKDKQTDDVQEQPKKEEPRPEVSKEQFYKVSDTLKETIAQPTTFSLRSLFGNESAEKESKEEEADYIPLEPPKKSKIKNPLQPGDKNPFVYDSSDSEIEVDEKADKTESTPVAENKAVWKESFFFGSTDQRLDDGLAFFSRSTDTEVHKERRELKSLMKKRIYNKERKDQMQMFRKKIGGRKKTMKKSFRRKN